MVSHGHRGNVRWSIGMTKMLLITAAIAGISLLPSIANAQERLGDGAMGAWREPWSAVRSGWSRAAWSAIRPGRQLLRAGASEGTGIIAMSIIADIRRDNPALRGFA
jgi:hypothetical protein